MLIRARKNPETVAVSGFPMGYLFVPHNLVAEMGFEPHDLRVMSPTSYRAAPLRDIERTVFLVLNYNTTHAHICQALFSKKFLQPLDKDILSE